MKRNVKTIVTIVLGLVVLVALGDWLMLQFQVSWSNLIVLALLVVCPLSMLFMMRGKRLDDDRPAARTDVNIRGIHRTGFCRAATHLVS